MTRTLHYTSIAAISLALSACGLSPEARLDRAEAAYEQHRFTEARLDLATLLQDGDADPAIIELLARTQLQLGDGEGAAANLARLDALEAVPADRNELLAEAELLRGRYQQAMTLAEGLGHAEGARIAALSLLGMGETDAARARFEQGLVATGAGARLRADYAIFLMREGDLDRAEMLAAQARKAAPDALDPLLASARIAQSTGAMEDALRYFERASAFYPENRVALLGRIGVLGDQGRMAEARPLIEEAARRAPDDPDVIYLQARLAAEDADWKAVRTLLQPFETREDARLQLLYARSLVELGLDEQAIGKLAPMVRQAPGAITPRRLLAHAQLASGDAAAAYATIEPLANSALGNAQDLALYSKSAKASGRPAALAGALQKSAPAERIARLLAAGDKALGSKDWRAAISSYEELRGYTSDSNAMVLNNLAYAYGKAGQVNKAIALAEKAHHLAPGQASVKDTLGWLLVNSGQNRKRGIVLLEEAVKLAPANRNIANHLAAAREG